MLKHFRQKTVENVKIRNFFNRMWKKWGIGTLYASCDNILITAYLSLFFVIHMYFSAAHLHRNSELGYSDAEIRQNEHVWSLSSRNFEKIRIMTTFGSGVTQESDNFKFKPCTSYLKHVSCTSYLKYVLCLSAQ